MVYASSFLSSGVLSKISFTLFPVKDSCKLYSGGVVALEKVFMKYVKSALKSAPFCPFLEVSLFLSAPLELILYTSLLIEPFSVDW